MREIVGVQEFEKEVIESEIPVLVKFTGTWCKPCQALQPTLEAVMKEVGDKIKFVKIDVDDNTEIVQEYAVRSIPKLILFRDGVDVKEVSGVVSKEMILKMFEWYKE